MKYSFSLILVSLFISGCNTTLKPEQLTAAEILKPGMSIELNQPIKIDPNSAYIFMQNGHFISESDLNNYYTYCKLEMYKPVEIPRTIKPAKFIIKKIVSQIEYVMTKPVKLAMSGSLIADGSGIELYFTTLYLESDINPGVELLSCEYWRDPTSFKGHVTLKDIKQTLEGIFQITEQ